MKKVITLVVVLVVSIATAFGQKDIVFGQRGIILEWHSNCCNSSKPDYDSLFITSVNKIDVVIKEGKTKRTLKSVQGKDVFLSSGLRFADINLRRNKLIIKFD